MIGVSPRPSSVARRSASSPWRRPSAKAPSALKVRASHAWDSDPHVCTGRARLPVRRLHVPPQQLGRPAEVADGIVDLPQAIGGLHLQGAVAERGRERRGPAGPPPWRRRGLPSPCVPGPSRPAPVPAGPGRRAPGPGPRPRPTGRGTAHTLPVASARLPTRGGDRWPAPGCRRPRAGARGPGGPARRRPPPRGTRRGRRPWHRPAGSRSRPCPTPRPAGHGGPGVRPARPPGPRASASRASTIRACSPRRRSWRRLP